jgi:hypothetical protein
MSRSNRLWNGTVLLTFLINGESYVSKKCYGKIDDLHAGTACHAFLCPKTTPFDTDMGGL